MKMWNRRPLQEGAIKIQLQYYMLYTLQEESKDGWKEGRVGGKEKRKEGWKEGWVEGRKKEGT